MTRPHTRTPGVKRRVSHSTATANAIAASHPTAASMVAPARTGIQDAATTAATAAANSPGVGALVAAVVDSILTACITSVSVTGSSSLEGARGAGHNRGCDEPIRVLRSTAHLIGRDLP